MCERTEDPTEVRCSLDDLSWSLLDVALGSAARTALHRSAKLIGQHEERMTPVHRRVTEAIKSHTYQPTRQTQIDIA